jgi:hypothetical protein
MALNNYAISFFGKYTIPYINCDFSKEEIMEKVDKVNRGY